jgi:serine/threonine protein kinase
VDLLKVKFSVKIADLGFSKYSSELENAQANMTMCGTPLYMSPQIVREGEYSAKTDIWSMGAIFFEMLTGVTPFQSKSMKQLDRDMQRGTYTMQVSDQISLESLHLLSTTLIADESLRMNAAELRYHPAMDMSY